MFILDKISISQKSNLEFFCFYYFRSIVDKNPGIIEGIVLAPTLGTMYWHDDDGDKETLKTSRMDGTRVDQVCNYHF
jgi:hypothetical protein